MEVKDKMRTKHKYKNYQHNLNVINKRRVKQQETPNWMHWCRLCAKGDTNNFNVFYRNDPNVECRILATAIGKYFWVNIKPEDEISQFICSECYTLVDSLVTFTERVNKVQTMFYVLQNSSSSDPISADELRLQYGLLDEERQHIIKTTSSSSNDVELFSENETKPTLIFELDEENDDEQEIDDECDEEYKQALKEFEQHENAVSSSSNDVELFSENETSIAPKKVEINQIKKFFKKESSITLDEKITNNTEIEESDEVDEYSVDDDIGADDNNLGEEDIHDNTAEPKSPDKKHITSSNRIVTPYARARPTRKRGRPRKYRSAEENNENALEKKIKIENESNDGADEVDNLAEGTKFSCKLCPKKYKSIVLYRRHMQDVHNILDQTTVEYHCNQCDKVCLSERQLTAHVQTHLPLELKQTYPCPYCEKKFTKEIIVAQHIQGVHLNEKPFICEECGRALKTNAALKEHKLTHTNDCPFECLVCHKRFKNNARLKIHMDTHNATVYTCDECGLQLNTRRTLNMHMLVHSSATPFKCDHCGTEFKRAKALKNHLIIHTGLKPYICEFCNKAFANGSNCRSHKKKTHPNELAAAEAQGISPRPNNVPKLDHLREVTKYSKNLQTVNKQVRIPSNWREVLLKSEAQGKRLPPTKNVKRIYTTEDTQSEVDTQQEYEQEVQQHEDEGDAIIIENMVSDGNVGEEIEVQLKKRATVS